MSLLTGFLMVGCRHLQSLGNPQEFYFVGILHFTPEPLGEIPDPSALVLLNKSLPRQVSPHAWHLPALQPLGSWCSAAPPPRSPSQWHQLG